MAGVPTPTCRSLVRPQNLIEVLKLLECTLIKQLALNAKRPECQLAFGPLKALKRLCHSLTIMKALGSMPMFWTIQSRMLFATD